MVTALQGVRQPDRAPASNGTFLATNRSQYVSNNPTNATDPSGLLSSVISAALPGVFLPNGEDADDQKKVNAAKEKVLMYEPFGKIFRQAKEGLGGTLNVRADRNVTTGGWDFENKTIRVNPNVKDRTLESIIIFETLNASKNKSFKELTGLAEMGKLNRIDYVIGVERIEFENLLEFRKIATGKGAEAALGKKTVDLFKEIDSSKDPWTLYLDSMFTPHAQNLGMGWTKLYKKAWDKESKNADPDEPLREISKKVAAEWISDWRKVWKGK